MKLRLLKIVASLLALSCGPPSGPIVEPIGGASPIDVQRLAARPRLTLVRRAGDPSPALALTAASDAGAVAHVALAAVLEERLADRFGRASGDAIGLRLSLVLDDDEDLEALLVDLVAALSAPIVATEVESAAARVEALRQRPLDAPALVPLAACSGEPQALAKEVVAPTVESLEAARARLSVDAMALGFVGSRERGAALSEALARVGGWPAAQAPEAWPRPSHGAYLTATLEPGAAEAHVAVRLPDASRAVAAAQRLGRPSPLAHKLALLEHPWRLESVRATAHPRGACLRVRIAPAAPIALDDLPAAAAAATARVEAELVAEHARGGPSFRTTREILKAGDARATAEHAAWWALHEPVDRPAVALSALAVGAGGREPLAIDDEGLAEAYSRAIAPAAAGELEAQLRAEPGQGELWLLVASPCALQNEEGWDAGLSALAATAAAAQAQAGDEVAIEPWVSPRGVGLLAHAPLAERDETPAALAERVGDALGRALTALPGDPDAIALAQEAVLTRLGDERAVALSALAQRIEPRHPSWLSPWGVPANPGRMRREDVMLRWRTLLHAGWRAAVIANAGEDQGEVALASLRRWLPPPSASCGERAEAAAFQPGSTTFESTAPHATTLVAADARDAPAAALVAEALDATLLSDALGPAATRAEARVVGDPSAASLVVAVESPESQRDEVKRRLEALLSRLANEGLPEDALARARVRARQRLAHPAARVAAAWASRDEPADVDAAAVARWTRANLAPPRLAWAVEE